MSDAVVFRRDGTLMVARGAGRMPFLKLSKMCMGV